MQKFLVVSRWCCLVIFWGISLCGYAELKLPSFFTDHMVLQSEKDIFVWGEATPYALVNVALGEQQKETPEARIRCLLNLVMNLCGLMIY